jgi:hypothetical protein
MTLSMHGGRDLLREFVMKDQGSIPASETGHDFLTVEFRISCW